jgi:hypothetical protein
LRGTEQSTERCEGGRGDPAAAAAAAGAEQEEIASLAERHRVSPAIVREIIRRAGTSERAAVEREIHVLAAIPRQAVALERFRVSWTQGKPPTIRDQPERRGCRPDLAAADLA